jgi:HEPN domain-containing protein
MDSRSYAQEWFELAKLDIEVAQFLLTMRPKPNEIIAYHFQQAAEKYVNTIQ